MPLRVIIHAPNVHQGGGATLLSALLDVDISGLDLVVVVDARFRLPLRIGKAVDVRRVKPTLLARLHAEWNLRKTAREGDLVLCFGNLPPLFPIRGRVVLFLQNRLLIDDWSPLEFPLDSRVRIAIERLWVRSRVCNVNRVIVQTRTMRHLVAENLNRSGEVIPFVKSAGARRSDEHTESEGCPRFDFLYVSSGEPHKNHLRLLDAWRMLADDGIRPHLALTLSEERHALLCGKIDRLRQEGDLKVTNLGEVSHADVDDLLRASRAVIYPSLLESFGLPLLEAAAAKRPVLAPELDYVRDVVQPVQSFDPTSALSIARAVRRFLGYPETVSTIGTAADFWEELIHCGNTDEAPGRDAADMARPGTTIVRQ